MATRRALVDAAGLAIQEAGNPAEDGQAHIGALEASLSEIANKGAVDEWIDGGVAVAQAVAKARVRDGSILFTWGIEDLDAMTGGLNAGESVIVAGRPGMMKSGVGVHIALANARKGLGASLISLEMAADPMGLRMACATAHDRREPTFSGQPHQDGNPWYVSAAKGQLSERQWSRLDAAQQQIARLPLLLDARAGLTVSRIEASVRRAHRKWRKAGVKPGPVIIDHLGIVRPEKARNGNKTAEVADVSTAADRAAELQNQQFEKMLALQMPGYNRGEQAAQVYMSALGIPSMTGSTGARSDHPSMGGGLMTGGRDWQAYLNQNPDVLSAIDGGAYGGPGDLYGAAARHYDEYGQSEGRAAPAVVTQQQQIADQVMNTPGYQAQLDQGMKAIDRAAPLTGGMYSGRRMKALNEFGQNTFGSYYSDWMNRVGGVAGQGQQVAQNVGQQGVQNAQNVGGLMVQGANARAQGSLNSASAWSGAMGDAVGAGSRA